ncbi:MAG TPA: polyprenyl diphosphate synthase [Amycolatopsis sp.]|nr:polyprenyl diphosphate synthase [Amycolatopsis sp.]
MLNVYAKAAILDPDLRNAYAVCRRIVRRRTPDDYALTQLVPPALRPAYWALWAALIVTDDLADHGGDAEQRAAALEAWTAAFTTDLERGTSCDPVRRALVHTMLTWNFSSGEIYASLRTMHHNISDDQPDTWEQWRTERASFDVATVNSVLVLAGAGLGMPVRLRDLGSWRRWGEATLLVDSLLDLPADLARGHLVWPVEAFEQAGADPADLLARRWTPGVESLTKQVNALALRWLRLDTVGLPPWLTMLFDSATAMFRARLRETIAAGPALLHRSPGRSAATRWRILGPARARAAVLWRLIPITAPALAATAGPAAPALPARTTEAPLPPVPHPDRARPPELPPEDLPRHVAIVMDGNGRWATQRGLPRAEGHRSGAKTALDIIHGALEIGLPYLTLYTFSTENWKRSHEEVESLMTLLKTFGEESGLLERDVRVRWSGSELGMPADVVEEFSRLEDVTRHHTGLTCTLCVNYGGRAELALAAGALARAVSAGEVDAAHISERTLARYLPHPDLPDVDLLWRTGGEQRTSNFLPWQAVYAELYFTDTLWPDADRRDLWQAISVYTQRERRYGSAPRPRTTRQPPAGELPAPYPASFKAGQKATSTTE